jgi:hypothetical protein
MGMQTKEFFSNTARTVALVAVVSAACSYAIVRSFPYRIHEGLYTWYLWAQWLQPLTMIIGAVAAVCAFQLGTRSRQRVPIILAVVGCVFLILSIAQSEAHSGPNPQTWCYNNLRKIDSAKEQFAIDSHITNAALTGAQISKYIERGFDSLKCAKHGTYTVGEIGKEPRCSFHGSISEMHP